MNEEIIPITSRDYWFKVVAYLQQNWALLDSDERGATVWFIGDTSWVFDQMSFPSAEEALRALTRNGFRRLADDEKAQRVLSLPKPPFRR